MTEQNTHTPEPYSEKATQPTLDLEFDEPGVAPSEAVSESESREPEPSPAYLELKQRRETAVERRRSGAKAIARAAFAALRGGKINPDEYRDLFPLPAERPKPPVEPPFEELSTERPPRPLDHAELAAGEGVRRPGDERDDQSAA